MVCSADDGNHDDRYLIVVPAYGRRYDTENAVIADWNGDKDFLIISPIYFGSYVNKSDVGKYTPGAHVIVRYDMSSHDKYCLIKGTLPFI